MTLKPQESKQQTSLLELMERIKGFKVLCIGDAIIDEYCYVRPLGKSPKEHIIATQYTHRETFRGGIWAAAKHVEGFCAQVDIEAGFIVTTKRRFVDEETIRKLFEVHETSIEGLSLIQPELAKYDLLIVGDFGHGCISGPSVTWLTGSNAFLAVNAQTNSANTGFNLITKYPRADYIVIDELEARLAAHDRTSPLEQILAFLRSAGFKRVVVTLGSHGSVGLDETGFYREPSVAHEVADTMGAGDAFFSVTAPFAAAGASMRDLLRIGNAAGAIKCAIVGHRASVTKESLMAYLAS